MIFYKTSETHPMNDDAFRSILMNFLGPHFGVVAGAKLGQRAGASGASAVAIILDARSCSLSFCWSHKYSAVVPAKRHMILIVTHFLCKIPCCYSHLVMGDWS